MAEPGLDPVPAQVAVERLQRLRTRLGATRRVPLISGVGWDRGVDAGYLGELLNAWQHYDWRPTEDRLRALPWVITDSDPPVRSIHQVADPDAPTVVLLHGWPDSFLRFARVLPLLIDVNVVVPCLPGFPYGFAPTRPGMSTTAMAELVAGVMADLGCHRYVVSGGDVGSSVAEAMSHAHPDRVSALHLTDVPYTHIFTVEADDLSEEEQSYLQAGQRWQFAEGAYALEQSTKPHTLAVGLGDSPAGLAAWIVEKLRSWSDCGGDVESVWSREELLDWITLYWATDTIGTSFTPYVERAEPITGRIEVPTYVSIFPHDLVPAPRSFGMRFFDIRAWREHPDGGHFAAWERPDPFVADLREAIAQE